MEAQRWTKIFVLRDLIELGFKDIIITLINYYYIAHKGHL